MELDLRERERHKLSHIQNETNDDLITINVIITEYVKINFQLLWPKASR